MTDLSRMEWIAVDWGTTRVRAWAVAGGGEVLAHATSKDGMGQLAPDAFEDALLALIGPWLSDPVNILACGMVGARQGWIEAPYSSVPAKPADLSAIRAPGSDPRLNVWIVPGLSQSNPADVMRGEETQIAGFLAQDPGFDGIIALPGTHTKWVHVSAEEVVSFQTFMTGETFSLLANDSVLRHSVAGRVLDHAAFMDAVSDSLSHPERLAARLFSIRADATLNATAPEVSRARLSGHLIGAELAAARPYWLGQDVVVAGEDALANLYGDALASQGVTARVIDADPLTLQGLGQLRRTVWDRIPT